MPDPTIDVNGENVGLKTRRYGSSDVLTKFSVMSLSASSSNGMRPGARDGEARRRHLERVDVHLLLANRQLRGDLADALVADVEVVDGGADVVARRLERRVALAPPCAACR